MMFWAVLITLCSAFWCAIFLFKYEKAACQIELDRCSLHTTNDVEEDVHRTAESSPGNVASPQRFSQR